MDRYDYLAHHGIKNQKWYQRRYQNPDGSLTPLGRVHYGVGEARKKVTSAAKTTSGSIKKTASSLNKARKESMAAAKKRNEERKEQRQAKKAELLERKIVAVQSRKKLSDLKDELSEARLESARKRVEALAAKNERILEEAELKRLAKELKKENKRLKKDVGKDADRLSNRDIRNMSDEDIQRRKARLKDEADLRKLEFERNHPATTGALSKLGDAMIWAGTEAVKTIGKDALTKYGRKYLGLDEIGKTPKSRTDQLRDAVAEMKAEKEYDDYVSGRAYEPKLSSEDKTKEYALELTKRNEYERRAKAYKKNDLTIPEIAEQMGLSESEVKSLLYVK